MTAQRIIVLDDDLAQAHGVADRLLGEVATAIAILFAPSGELVARVERQTGARIGLKGNEVRISAATAALAEAVEAIVVELFVSVCRQGELDDSALWRLEALGHHAAPVTRVDPATSAAGAAMAPAPAIGAPHEINLRRGKVESLSVRQGDYVASMTENTITFATGPAGTGKTYLGMCYGIQLLEQRRVDRIVVARPALEAGERIGFLPGAIDEKMDPWLRPVFDVLYERMGKERTEKLRAEGVIELAPLAFMRGRTLRKSFVLLDEAQNTTQAQMKMFLTRIGLGSTMVVTGDPAQSDLPSDSGVANGLSYALARLHDIRSIGIIQFDNADVRRHPLIGHILQAWERS